MGGHIKLRDSRPLETRSIYGVFMFKLYIIPSSSSSTQHYLPVDEDETFRLHNFQLQAMLKRFAHSLGLVEHTDRDPRRKNQLKGTKASRGFSLQSKDFVVRIVHAGGKQELYQHAIPASKLMGKYPGMCVARPEVFKSPHESVLWPEERLLPGHKYFIIPSRHVEKLKSRHPEQGKTKDPNGVVVQETVSKITRSPNGHKPKENGKVRAVPNGEAGQEMLEAKTTVSPSGCKMEENGKVKEANGVGEEIVNAKTDGSQGGGDAEELFFSANDFHVSKQKWKRCSRRRGIAGKQPFVPPLPKARLYRGLGWQPSLPPVKELSP